MKGLKHGRRRQLTGATAGVLAPLFVAHVVNAGNLDVTGSQTTAVTTSNADGNGPGDVTVETNGSISVGDLNAVTVDSSNSVTNSGTIATSNQGPNAAAVFVNTGNSAANVLTSANGITNSGTLSVTGPAATSSLVNTNVYNAGISVQGLGTWNGSITNSGTISVNGQQSYGIWVNAPMVGSITNSSAITVTGTSDSGILTSAPVNGSITNSGTISIPGSTGVGMYVGSTVTGNILQSGSITVGTGPTVDTTTVNPVTGLGATIPEVPATAGIWLAGNVNQGLYLAGSGYTNAQEAANTSINASTDSHITTNGGAPGILVMPGGSGGYQNILIGENTSSPYAIISNGKIVVNAATQGLGAVGINVQGASFNGTNYTAALAGGIYNAGGNINVTSINAPATGVHIGAGGIVPELLNTGDILVLTEDNTADNSRGIVGTLGGTAYGVVVDPGGVLNKFTNYGNLTVTSQGPNSSYAFIDRSGTVTTFFNAGSITPIIDQLSPGTVGGVDLSANTTGITFTNNGNITGPVILGSGNNTYSMSVANQNGNLTFLGGNNTLTIGTSTVNGNINLGTGGASTVTFTNSTLNGGLTYTNGSVNFSAVTDSHINIPDSQFLNVTNASIDGSSTVNFSINGQTPTGGGALIGTGNVSIANGAQLTPVFTNVFTSPQTVRLISAGSLNLGAPITSLVNPNASFMNTYTVQIDPNNPNSVLLNVRRKTAGEMGLDANMASVYNSSIGALTQDVPVATAIQAQATRNTFLAAFRQLMPDVTDATRQVALSAQDLTLGAVRRHLMGIPDTRAGQSGDRSSVWFQGLGAGGDAKQEGDELGYSYWGIGLALGADAALTSTTKIGAAVTEMFTSIDYGASQNSPLVVFGTHVNLYGRQDIGPFYLQGMGGAGYNDYRETHTIDIAALRRTSIGKGNGYQAGGTVEFGTGIGLGDFMLDPYVRAAYLSLKRNTFTQSGGGAGIDYQVDANTQSSERGSAGFQLERDFTLYYDSMLETDLRGSYTREFHNTPTSFNGHFLSNPSDPFSTSVLLHGPGFYSFGFGVGHKDSFSSVTLDYDAQIAKGFIGHTATVTLRFRL